MVYIDFVFTLLAIQKEAAVKPNVCVLARGYTEALLRYETIVMVQIFLQIFEHTVPLHYSN